MIWWIIALILLLGYMAGLDLVGLFVVFVVFLGMTIGTLAGVDKRRRHKLHPPTQYHPHKV